MIKTTAGLPNTCWQCGAGDLEHWYAPNIDRAVNGGGICESCYAPKPEPEPEPAVEPAKPTRRRKA